MKSNLVFRDSPFAHLFSSTANARLSRPQRFSNLSMVRWIALLALTGLSGSAVAAQEPGREPPAQDAQKCVALAQLNLEAAPGGPALITSARLVEVPAGGLEPPFFHPSGYASGAPTQITHHTHQYFHVPRHVP